MNYQLKIKKAIERNRKAILLKPAISKSVGKSTIRVKNGTTCEIEGSDWKITADVGKESGGNNAGPGPGVLERAALGSCLAIGYVQQAALMDINFHEIEVEVQSEFDSRGHYGLSNDPPGFTSLHYTVNISSGASKEKIRKLIDIADNHSPVLDDFSRPIPVTSKVNITNKKGFRT